MTKYLLMTKWFKVLLVVNVLVLLHPLADGAQSLSAQVVGVPKIFSATAKPDKKKLSGTFHTSDRRIQYIGRLGDSLYFTDLNGNVIQTYSATSGSSSMGGANETENADSGMVVIVDTNQTVGITETNAGTATYDAHPVIVRNNTNKNLIIGRGARMPVTLEALDRGNNWKTVETTSVNSNAADSRIILKPGDVVGIAIPVYSGSFKTLMRVRVFDNYSEPFSVFLNHSQLIEPVK